MLLSPKYVPFVQQQPLSARTVRRRTQEAEEVLKDCFEFTDWDALCQPFGEDRNVMTVGLWPRVVKYIAILLTGLALKLYQLCFTQNSPCTTDV